MFNFEDLNNQFHIILATRAIAKTQKAYHESLLEEGFDEEMAEKLVTICSACLIESLISIGPELLQGNNERD